MPNRSGDANAKSPAIWLPATVIATATVFTMLAIALRWFVQEQGQVIQLMLIAGSVLSTLLILTCHATPANLVVRVLKVIFAICAVTAVFCWSPGFAFSLMVSAPMMLAVFVLEWLEFAGYELRLVHSQAAPTADTNRRVPATQVVAADAPLVIEVETESAASEIGSAASEIGSAASEIGSEPDHESIIDPWLAVQNQFQSDNSLMQNVAQWQDADGNRCIVANLRCRFSTARETCVAHLPFWPLLENEPEVFCRIASGPDATIKTTQTLPHGLRLEVRLNDRSKELSEPQDVIVEVVASLEVASSEIAA